MLRIRRPALGAEGSVMPLAIIVLSALALVGVAGFEAARFAGLAAGGQLEAAKALHGADTGLDTYGAGTAQAVGTFQLQAPWAAITVTASQLVRLADSTVVVLVESRAAAPSVADATGRRHLQSLFVVPPDGTRRAVVGSWKEHM